MESNFDVTKIGQRFYTAVICIEDESEKITQYKLEIEPPKLKTVRELEHIYKDGGTLEELEKITAKIVNKNKQNMKFTSEELESCFTFDGFVLFLKSFFEWVMEINNDPN